MLSTHDFARQLLSEPCVPIVVADWPRPDPAHLGPAKNGMFYSPKTESTTLSNVILGLPVAHAVLILPDRESDPLADHPGRT